jgi:hypothetical protein
MTLQTMDLIVNTLFLLTCMERVAVYGYAKWRDNANNSIPRSEGGKDIQ